jgi:hypothetical protein
MDTLRTHYARLLELNDSWEVADLHCLSKTTALRFGSSRLEAEFSAPSADRRAESPTTLRNAVGGISTPCSSSQNSWLGYRGVVALSMA